MSAWAYAGIGLFVAVSIGLALVWTGLIRTANRVMRAAEHHTTQGEP